MQKILGKFKPLTTEEKIEQHIYRDNATGCWEWTGRKNQVGYGGIALFGKTLMAHRVVYELHKGEIPKGYVIDHLCRNPGCVNPDHLQPVTQAENYKRGIAIEAVKKRFAEQTHCKRGHPLSGDNLYIPPGNPRRCCKECDRLKGKQYRERRKAKRIEQQISELEIH